MTSKQRTEQTARAAQRYAAGKQLYDCITAFVSDTCEGDWWEIGNEKRNEWCNAAHALGNGGTAVNSPTMFGTRICKCHEDEQDEEVINGVVYCANCKGVIRLHIEVTT